MDHIFTNIITEEVEAGNIYLDITDHHLNYIIIKNAKEKIKKGVVIRQRNYTEINRSIKIYDWEQVSKMTDVDGATEKIINELNDIIRTNTFETTTTKHYTIKKQPWISNGILRSLRKRDKLKQKMNKSGINNREKRKKIYDTYRKILERTMKQAKKDHYYNFFDKNKNDSKRTWSEINHILASGKKGGFGQRRDERKIKSLKTADSFLTENQQIVESVNDYFINIARHNIDNPIKAINIVRKID